MSRLVRSLVVINGLLLALPVGWCCPAPASTERLQPAKKADCCHRSQPVSKHGSAPRHHPGPAKSSDSCCCPADRLTPEKTKRVKFDGGPAAPVDVPARSALMASDPGNKPVEIHSHSPPLNVLHCVWRC